jgi:hypothetical protein
MAEEKMVKVVALRNTVISRPAIQLWMGEVYDLPEKTVNLLVEHGDVRMYGGPSEDKAAGPPTANKNAIKLASDLGIDLAEVEPTGKGGRITKTDVKKFAKAAGLGG